MAFHTSSRSKDFLPFPARILSVHSISVSLMKLALIRNANTRGFRLLYLQKHETSHCSSCIVFGLERIFNSDVVRVLDPLTSSTMALYLSQYQPWNECLIWYLPNQMTSLYWTLIWLDRNFWWRWRHYQSRMKQNIGKIRGATCQASIAKVRFAPYENSFPPFYFRR